MNTKQTHGYRGITAKAGYAGWMIQIRLLGRYRQINAHTANPDVAARRHDIAISKLDCFTDKHSTPNFPETFSTIDISRGGDKEEGHDQFWNTLHGFFQTLHSEAEVLGIDPDKLLKEREAEREAQTQLRELKLQSDRARFVSDVCALGARLQSLRLGSEKTDSIGRALSSLRAQVKDING